MILNFMILNSFRINVRKSYLNESVFRHCYSILFESVILKVTWSKFLLTNFLAHSKQHFERNPAVEDFTDMDQDMSEHFPQNLRKHHEMENDEVALEIYNLQKKYDLAFAHFKIIEPK